MSQHCIRLFISNPTDRRLLAEFLAQTGHRVDDAPLRGSPADVSPDTSLVIADSRAAREHFRAIVDLRWRAGVGYLPLLILLPTGVDSTPWISAGFDDVLRQPIMKNELRARLAVFLRFRDQSQQFRLMFEQALIGMYHAGADARLVLANPALVRMLGFESFEQLAAAEPRSLRIEPSADELARRLQQHDALPGFESSWRRRDGSALIALENARGVRDGAGALRYIEGSVEDITQRKHDERERERLLAAERAARAEAEAASRLKDEFLATVSHELRTPLTAIIGWAHLLRSGRVTGATIAEGLEAIERQARAQSQLVEDLLDVSRIITGNLRLNVQPVAPAAFVDAGIEAVTPAADAKGVVIRKEFSPGVAAVAGDSARLQQVVWNLLSNAVKFTPRGGEVTVRLEPVDAGVRITIADTGEGIRPEFLPYVFDRFRQQDGRTSRRHGGLGLGLAIVRHLVELHGGTVRADSGGEGRGATFEVVLPVGGAAQPPAPPMPPAESAGAQPVREPPALAGLKVLLVDDEPDTLKLLELVLSRAGAQVAIADSAEAALQRLQQERPDVLVSDIAMPGTDGYELIRRLRQRGERVAAAALTAYARPQDRERALQSGYSAHIAKPVEPAELLAVIASLSGRRDAGSADAGCTSTRDASGEDAAAQ